jgi:hypothetical protein
MGSNKNGLPTGTLNTTLLSGNGYTGLSFTDTDKGLTSNLYLILSLEDDGVTYDPLLATDQGLVVKKDIAAGGFVSANQGVLYLGSGLNSATDEPRIILMHSGTGRNTLYLKQFSGSSAHLDLGNFTSHGLVNFADSSGSNYAYIKWKTSSTAGVFATSNDLGLTYDDSGTTRYWGTLDTGALYTQYLQPLSSSVGIKTGGFFTPTSASGTFFKAYYGGGTSSNGGITIENAWGNFYFVGGDSGSYWHIDQSSSGTILFQVWRQGYISVPQSLSSSGTVYSNGNGTLYNSGSAKKYKDNIEPVNDSSWIYNLSPVTFYWKADQQELRGKQQEIGLIADDVDTICPLLTWKNNSGEVEGVKYEKLTVPMLVEMKKLRDRIIALEAQLKEKRTAA